VTEIFARIERLNAALAAKQGSSRLFVRLEGDVRTRPRHVGVASQHRVYAALRETRRRDAQDATAGVQPGLRRRTGAGGHSRGQAVERQPGRAFLAFTKDDPLGPLFRIVLLTRRFQRLATLAGLPVIKLHEGRHSAASLARDAAVDPEIRRRTLGHADAAMTAHYTHIEAEAYKAAAEAVAKLVDSA
jgi:hypothetical protein